MKFTTTSALFTLAAVASAQSSNTTYAAGPYAINGTSNGTAAGAVGGSGSSPVYVTEVVTAITTYCPAATTLTVDGNVYTVAGATTLTITDCPCTVTSAVVAATEAASSGAASGASSAASAENTANAASGAASGAASSAVATLVTSTGSSSGSTKTASSSLAVFTGAASREMVGAGSILAALGSFLLL